MRIDLHCHTEASHDCVTPLAAMAGRCRERGIDVQAITDHNTVRGALELRERVADAGLEGELTIVVGEEISTREGEIIGLFLEEEIPRGLSPEETIDEITAQGGLVLLPHGFDPRKVHRLRPGARGRVAERVDIVEAFNARVSNRRWNTAAGVWAAERGIPPSAGSDAHTLRDVGSAWVETPAASAGTPAELLAALADPAARVEGEWTHPLVAFAYKAWTFARAALPGGGPG